MKNSLEKVAKLLMYEGPRITDLIAKAVNEKKHFYISKTDGMELLTIEFTTAYNTSVQDKYFFNSDKELIKQLLIINTTEKIIFDKYADAKSLLQSIDFEVAYVS
ncbi:hypothetical protein V7149_01930 [Bacillus sp. JJ1503]|uniref:hypothetical protein n=1 Tax=Bacillus sp. JJ1503 TaxID=3122956 RepID=UPI003000A593